VPDTLDAEILHDAEPFFRDGEKMQLSYTMRNTHRTIGTRVSSHIVRRFGMANGLQPDHLTVKLTGSAGQSLGAFAARGLKLVVHRRRQRLCRQGAVGRASWWCGRTGKPAKAPHNTIIGNTVLYGATAGWLFAAGQAGERFAVRNSGAEVVVEGCGSNGCEYMTGGMAVILGSIGANFGAGMTGGMAWLFDPHGRVTEVINMETLVAGPLRTSHWEDRLNR
jgi:glutamate synthase (NADPH/NADH) large chain